ncbi:MAG: hypothetical protein IM638_06845 [Bacteroidetes bacterium]|nr:hypothetical protein [Bacteroidota bacterium]
MLNLKNSTSYSFLVLFCALLQGLSAQAQYNDYSLVKSKGDIPADFIQPVDVRTKNSIQRLGLQSVNAQNYVWASESVFSYYVNSGMVTLGDSVSLLCTQIIDRLLVSNKALRQNLNVYLLRSSKPEIYTFYNGNMLVSTGILARTANEAQLAYLIAREIIVYRNIFDGRQITSTKLNFQKDSLDLESAVFTRSEEEESAADRQALKMYLEAGYDASEAITALKLLYNPEASFDDVPFDLSFFEHGDYVFPPSYHLKELVAGDTNSFNEQTNLQLSRRITILKSLIQQVEAPGNKFILQTEAEFISLSTLAKQEVMRQFFIDQQHEYAIYSAYLLLKKDSTYQPAKSIIAHSLNTLAIYKTQSIPEPPPLIYIVPLKPVVNSVNTPPAVYTIQPTSNIAGEAQHINYLLHQLSYTEFYILALDWQWKNLKALKKADKSIEQTQVKRLMWMLKHNSGFSHVAFSPAPFKPISLGEKYEVRETTSFTLNRKPSVTLTPPSQLLNKSVIGSGALREKPKEAPEFSATPKKNIEQISTQYDIKNSEDVYQSNTNTLPLKTTYFNVKSSRLISDEKAIVQWKGMPDDSAYSYAYVYYLYAFTSHMKDSTFVETFRKAGPQGNETPLSDYSMRNRIVYDKRSKYGLGADTVLIGRMLAVNYSEIKRTGTIAMGDELLDEYTQYQREALQVAAGYEKCYPFIPDLSSISSTDVASYTNWCMVKTWQREHDNYSAYGFSLPTFAYTSLGDSVSRAFHTPYITYTYAVSYLMRSTVPKSQLVSLVYELQTGYLVMYLHEENKRTATFDIQKWYYRFLLEKTKYPRLD